MGQSLWMTKPRPEIAAMLGRGEPSHTRSRHPFPWTHDFHLVRREAGPQFTLELCCPSLMHAKCQQSLEIQLRVAYHKSPRVHPGYQESMLGAWEAIRKQSWCRYGLCLSAKLGGGRRQKSKPNKRNSLVVVASAVGEGKTDQEWGGGEVGWKGWGSGEGRDGSGCRASHISYPLQLIARLPQIKIRIY